MYIENRTAVVSLIINLEETSKGKNDSDDWLVAFAGFIHVPVHCSCKGYNYNLAYIATVLL
jgi:hypothetical protein